MTSTVHLQRGGSSRCGSPARVLTTEHAGVTCGLCLRLIRHEARTAEWKNRCGVCGRDKKPVGRDAPIGSCYCDQECAGYRQEPCPPSWPEESGYEQREGFIDTEILNALKCLGSIIDDAPFVGEERDGVHAAFLENQKVILDAIKRLKKRRQARS